MRAQAGFSIISVLIALFLGSGCAARPQASPGASAPVLGGAGAGGSPGDPGQHHAPPQPHNEDRPIAAHGHRGGRLRRRTGVEHEHAARRLLARDIRRGWREPAEHRHLSACGTPMVHGFLTEPAFLGRDLIVGATYSGDEIEVEAEIEWSLTRRLGLIAEVPYVDADESGIGDLALGMRALLVEQRRFLLSASTEVELPTGSEWRGLGSGAVAVGAGFHTWNDLGSWITLQTQAGVEWVPEEEESDFKWSVTLAKSFRAGPLVRTSHGQHDEHGPAVISLIAELQGLTALSYDAGTTEGRWLLGASYPLTRHLDLRAAFSRSFGGEQDEEAWTLGFNFHF